MWRFYLSIRRNVSFVCYTIAKVQFFFGNHPEVYDIFKKIKLVLC